MCSGWKWIGGVLLPHLLFVLEGCCAWHWVATISFEGHHDSATHKGFLSQVIVCTCALKCRGCPVPSVAYPKNVDSIDMRLGSKMPLREMNSVRNQLRKDLSAHLGLCLRLNTQAIGGACIMFERWETDFRQRSQRQRRMLRRKRRVCGLTVCAVESVNL